MQPPPWTSEIDRALIQAARQSTLLACATPVNARATRAALVERFGRGDACNPEWTYAPFDAARAGELSRSLDALAEALDRHDPPALGRLYAERAREVALEVRLSSQVGSASFAAGARGRYGPGPGADRAAALARAWVAEPPDPADEEPRDRTTDAGEGSLMARLKEEIGRRRLPFRVVPAPSLASLAATGEGTIWVATGRPLAARDVERTVLHEIEGHAAPRAAAARLALGLFAIGTARGADDQEGLALVYEERAGFLRGARRRELGLRHRAVVAMDGGASYAEAVRSLLGDGAPVERAVLACERAFRGSDGRGPGLGRERVYLASFTRVAEHLAARPEDERVLASGQVAVDAIATLAPYGEG